MVSDNKKILQKLIFNFFFYLFGGLSLKDEMTSDKDYINFFCGYILIFED